MRFLGILEKAWLSAIVVALGLGIYSLIVNGNFSYHVYTPFICACFCVLIYMNIRRQRLFLEKMKKEEQMRPKAPTPPDIK